MTRYTLLYQTHSPFARKALVFAHEVGLADQVDVVHHETSPTLRNQEVFSHNPLGKVPVLLRPGEEPLFDSDVICAYLDTQHAGQPLIPRNGEARWRALRVQAVAQGLADAGIAYRWETVRRPQEMRYEPLRVGYETKLVASYDWLERELEPGASIDIGQIAAATALSWLEFRALPSFRQASSGQPRRRLIEWFDHFERRPSMRATPLVGETQDAGEAQP